MNRNGAEVMDSELRAIVRRLDLDGDTHISFSEFKRFFQLPLTVKEKNVLETSMSSDYNMRTTFHQTGSPRRFESPNRSINVNQSLNRSMDRTINRSFSPNRTVNESRRYLSPQRALNKSVERVNLNRSIDDVNRSRINRNITSPDRSRLNMTTSSPDRFRTTNLGKLNTSSYDYISLEEENFISLLRNVIEIENDIEKIKLDLVLRTDFNIEDGFRIFELDSRGYINDLDLKYGLNSLDVFPSAEEINLLMRRYDLRGEGVLRYTNLFKLFSFSNFLTMIAPNDREYRRMLENRIPSNFTPRYNKIDVFLSATKIIFSNLLNNLVRAEARIEGLRQRLNKLPRLNARSLFEKIDSLGKNYFSENDVNI